MKYYVAENEQPVGPFDVDELVARGLKGTDLVWAEGFEGWVPADSVEEIRTVLYAPSGTPVVPQPGQAPAQCPPPPYRPAYQQPQYQQPQYTQPQPVEAPPKNWMVESILVTLCCCIPFGIVGIVMAYRVNSLWRQGFYDEARKASADAKRWTIIGFVCGIVSFIVNLVLMIPRLSELNDMPW